MSIVITYKTGRDSNEGCVDLSFFLFLNSIYFKRIKIPNAILFLSKFIKKGSKYTEGYCLTSRIHHYK